MPHGIVLMMDVLGVSRYTPEECVDFLDKINRFGEMIKTEFKLVSEYDRQTAIYGDTVIICWSFSEELSNINYDSFDLLSLEMIFFMAKALENGLLFRGCVSIGEYVTDNNIILGPAIFDAHDWYELTDWFGIILSPKTRIWLESITETEDLVGNSQTESHWAETYQDKIVAYDVPLNRHFNEQKTKNFFTIAWPFFYKFMRKRENKMTSKGMFLQDLLKIPISKEGEPKFKHSIDYFNWYDKIYHKQKKLNQKSKPKERAD